MIRDFKNNGFSFIEIVAVVAVLLIMAVLTTAAFSSFLKSQKLNRAVEEAASLIHEARSKTLASEAASQYGIHFTASTLTLFKGSDFIEAGPDNKELVLSPSVELFDISLSGGVSDLVFERLTGQTSQSGRVSFRLKTDTSKIKIIIIEPSGLINY